ncbi:MAG: hypothetical protein MJ003_00055 [Paludibacteraceae bacterium]|nr:hypothetical protein [Paludibacteraceae bacterium]
MKRFLLFFSIFCTVILASCRNENVISPKIEIKTILINSHMIKSDTLFVGDTLQFVNVALLPYYDKLEYFQLKIDRALMSDSVFTDADFEQLCDTAASDRSEGLYVFKNMNNGDALLLNVIKTIAIKSPETKTNDVNIEFLLKSTANVKSEFNPFRQGFRFKIVNKEKQK